jgi:bifunctional non-homologous end joining protein LigD
MKQGAASNFYFIEPMMALRVPDLPVGNWIYELKFDGYRALAFKAGKEVRLVSRNRTNFNNDYPQVVEENLLSTFYKSYGTSKQIPLVYHAFDLLSLDGTDLCSRPLVERRKLLAKLLRRVPDNIRFSEDLRGNRKELLEVARQFQLEGLIAKGRIRPTRPAGAVAHELKSN